MNAQALPSGPQRTEYERQLARDIGSCARDPLKYALYNWPGLELRQWQVDDFSQIRDRLNANPYQPIQSAVASGHGIGKGCDGAILTHWAMSTREMTRGVVTANTDTQLRTKTWPELAKWHSLARNRHWFTCTATALYHPDYEKNWRIDAIPWSEHNTEAFAGLHNQGYRIILWMDEASAIHDKVWEVSEGALTDENTEILWLARGNPTRTTGRFRDCFGRFQHRWMTRHIDSRTVEGTNKVQLQKYVDDYGEDSDFVRVRVRGVFPSASSMQLIEADTVAQAMRREPIVGIRDPLIMGVDVARGGDDRFVIAYRRGMDGKTIPPVIIPGSEARDSMRMVARVVDLATTSDPRMRPDAIIVDETGVGGPIVDRLRQILGDMAQVYGVNFSSASPDPKHGNMRVHIWTKLRDWLRLGGCIPNDPEIERDFCGPEYFHDKRDRMMLESKDDMKDRGLPSCDIGDGYAITFSYSIQPRENTVVRGTAGKCLTDYDPYEARA